MGRLLSQGDVTPEVSNTVDGPDILMEDTFSTTLHEATPGDTLDESHVLDQCSLSDGAVSTLPSEEPPPLSLCNTIDYTDVTRH